MIMYEVLMLNDGSKLEAKGLRQQEFLTKTGFDGVKQDFAGVNTLPKKY